MARGNHTSPLSVLPQVSYRKIGDGVSTQPCGVHDTQARAFGFNDLTEFQRPDSYIRHIEPLESELAKQVEYDMDEQDREWLDTVNEERRKEQMTKISYEVFEIVMDRLEKEWFDLTKNLPKPDLVLPSEDSTCAICDDAEGENSNAIVFCDGCNLAVHQDCYGVPYIPEGQWLCRKCTLSPENPVTCRLCPNEGGAFKQTVTGDWAHLLCVMWIPGIRVTNETFMEPVAGIDELHKDRWKLKEHQDARMAALEAEAALEDSPGHNAKLAKSARAYAKSYKLGPPLVPAVIVNRIDIYIARIKISKRIPTLQMMCRYWSLKREARRGAPLLKRLHLEPWTAGSGGKAQTEEEKLMKLDQLNHLMYDLERLERLTAMTKKREKWKLAQARAIYDILDNSIFVHEKLLRATFERVTSLDRQDYFKNPVSRIDVPDYFDIVKNPMCWIAIEARLDRHEYWDVETFKDLQRDVNLVIDNAILYNPAGTPFYKAAVKMQNSSHAIFEDLRQKIKASDDSSSIGSSSHGDLEPPIELLEALISTDTIQDEIDIVLKDNPLVSLFNFALPELKPPPPPPPTPPPPPPKQQKSKLPAKTKKKKKQAADSVGTDTTPVVSPGRPRTRAAEASAARGEELLREPMEQPTEEQGPADESMEGAEPQDASVRAVTEEVDVMGNDTPPPSSGLSAAEPSKRAPRVSKARRESLPVVETISNKESFKMFNQGWILPAEQKRGGRTSIDRQSVAPPRPKKRMRLDPGPSRLSVVSTAATENQTFSGTPAPMEPPPPRSAPPATPEPIAESTVPEEHTTSDGASNATDEGPRGTPANLQTGVEESRIAVADDVQMAPAPPLPAENSDLAAAQVTEELKTVVQIEYPESVPPVSEIPLPSQTSDASEVDPDATEDDDDVPDATEREGSVESEDELTFVPLSARREKRPPPSARSKFFSDAPPLSSHLLTETARVVEENGRKVLETLDTPEIRKERQKEKLRLLKEKKQRELEALALTASTSQDPGSDALEAEDESGPSASVSAPLPTRGRGRGRGRGSSLTAWGRKALNPGPLDPDPVLIKEGAHLEGGTVVWAQARMFPWWPGVVWEKDDPHVPPNIKAEFDKRSNRGSKKFYVIQFYDKSRSWQILTNESLRMLGEDKEFDADLIATKSKRQTVKWTTKNMQECRTSYEIALKEIETASDLERKEPDDNEPSAGAELDVPAAAVDEGEERLEEQVTVEE
ncbi:hypothetical protein H0H92_002556 [Tricholoma furcatifolium]|nr:hypothetical protein H0H92_002556 [Tricholoma furcatifolium]